MATGGVANAQQYMRISDIAKEPQKILLPISGYEEMPLVTLEQAVAYLFPILPRISDYVFVAKTRCLPILADGLTLDQSASIMLYTMSWEPQEKCLYFVLNSALRSENRVELKPWFSYLKLIFTALSQLPSTHCSVYCGVKMNLTEQYPQEKEFIWWGFSSCTSSIEVLQNNQFLGNTGPRTLFIIDCNGGKDISRYTFFKSKEEILLLPGRQFKVQSNLQAASDVHIIQLKETKSPICFLQPVINESILNPPLSGKRKKRSFKFHMFSKSNWI
jgi:hypothetical protein